jgi:membrane protein implicated in regulation of membrane protease activity
MNMIAAIYINPWWLAFIIIAVVVLLYFVVIWVIRAHQRKVEAGKEDLIGRKAVVRTALNPKGMVFVEDELWNAVIDSGTAEPEEEVIITKVEGLKLTVTKK